jgi:hypothetical protein
MESLPGNELEIMWMKAFVSQFLIQSGHLTGGTEPSHEVVKCCQSPGRDLGAGTIE